MMVINDGNGNDDDAYDDDSNYIAVISDMLWRFMNVLIQQENSICMWKGRRCSLLLEFMKFIRFITSNFVFHAKSAPSAIKHLYVQGMTVKLRPFLCFRAYGWGCVGWKAPAGGELLLHFVRCDMVTVSPNQIIIIMCCIIWHQIRNRTNETWTDPTWL